MPGCCGDCNGRGRVRVIFNPCPDATGPSGDVRLDELATSGAHEFWPDYTEDEDEQDGPGELDGFGHCISSAVSGDWKIEYGFGFRDEISFSPVDTEYRIIFKKGNGIRGFVSVELISSDPIEYEVTFTGIALCIQNVVTVSGDDDDNVVSDLSFVNTSAPDKSTWRLIPAILVRPGGGGIFQNFAGSYLEIDGVVLYGGFPVNVFGLYEGQPPPPVEDIVAVFENSGWSVSGVPDRYANSQYVYSRTLGIDRSGFDWEQMVVLADECVARYNKSLLDSTAIRTGRCQSKVVTLSTKTIPVIAAMNDGKWHLQHNDFRDPANPVYSHYFESPVAAIECTIPTIEDREGNTHAYQDLMYYVLDDSDPASLPDYSGASGRIQVRYFMGVDLNNTVWCEIHIRDFNAPLRDLRTDSGTTANVSHDVWRYESDSPWDYADSVVTCSFRNYRNGYDGILYGLGDTPHSSLPDVRALLGGYVDVGASWHGRSSGGRFTNLLSPGGQVYANEGPSLSYEVNCSGCFAADAQFFAVLRSYVQVDGIPFSISRDADRQTEGHQATFDGFTFTGYLEDRRAWRHSSGGTSFGGGNFNHALNDISHAPLHHWGVEGDMFRGTPSSPLPPVDGVRVTEANGGRFTQGGGNNNSVNFLVVVRPLVEIPEPYIQSYGRYNSVTEIWVRNNNAGSRDAGRVTVSSYSSFDIYTTSGGQARNIGNWSAEFTFDRSLDLDTGEYGTTESIPRSFTLNSVVSSSSNLIDYTTPDAEAQIGLSDVFPVWALLWGTQEVRLRHHTENAVDLMLPSPFRSGGTMTAELGDLVFVVHVSSAAIAPTYMDVLSVSDSGNRIVAQYNFNESGPFSSADNYSPVSLYSIRDTHNGDQSTADSVLLSKSQMSRVFLDENVPSPGDFPQGIEIWPITSSPQQGYSNWQWSDQTNSWLLVSESCEENPDGTPIAIDPPTYSGCRDGHLISQRCSGSYGDRIIDRGSASNPLVINATVEVVFEKSSGTWSPITTSCDGRAFADFSTPNGGAITNPAPPSDSEGEDGDVVRKLCVFTPNPPPVPTCSWTWNGTGWDQASDSCSDLYGGGVTCQEPDDPGTFVGEVGIGNCSPDDCSERTCDWLYTDGFNGLDWYQVASRCYSFCRCQKPPDTGQALFSTFTNPCTSTITL